MHAYKFLLRLCLSPRAARSARPPIAHALGFLLAMPLVGRAHAPPLVWSSTTTHGQLFAGHPHRPLRHPFLLRRSGSRPGRITCSSILLLLLLGIVEGPQVLSLMSLHLTFGGAFGNQDRRISQESSNKTV